GRLAPRIYDVSGRQGTIRLKYSRGSPPSGASIQGLSQCTDQIFEGNRLLSEAFLDIATVPIEQTHRLGITEAELAVVISQWWLIVLMHLTLNLPFQGNRPPSFCAFPWPQ